MEVASLSPHTFPLLRFSFQESRIPPRPSSLTLCASKRLYTGLSAYRHGNLRDLYKPVQNGLLQMPTKCIDTAGCYFTPREKLNKGLYNNLYYTNKFSRNIVSRSELAGIGTTSSSNPLSEIELGPKVRGICFYAMASVAAIFLFMLMVVAHPFVLLFDRYQRKAQHVIAKIWASITVAPFISIKFEGLENLPSPDTPAVYVSNHQSFLDIYTLLTLGRSFKFISKTSIFLYPIIGWAMYLMGVIPLERLDSRSKLKCLMRCMDLIKKGASVFFFPEGTRSKDGKLGTFKKGAFSVAAKVKVPVVPITLIGTGNIMPVGMERIVKSGSVKVIIHKPIEGSDPEALLNEARKAISEPLSNQG